MIQSLFQFLRPHITEDGKITNIKSLLKQTLAWESFEGIYSDFGDIEGDKVSTFVIMMYCTDSTYFIASDNYEDTKIGIAELCGIDVKKYDDLLHLKVTSAVNAINFVASEIKSWRYKKMLLYRETAEMLGRMSTAEPDEKQKNAAKNIRDAAVFEEEMNQKADALEAIVFSQTRSQDRLKETLSVNIDAMSMESILKGIK